MSSGQPVPTKLPSNYAQVEYKEIKITHHPVSSQDVTPILVCTLYRPSHNNAFTDVMTDELEHFFGIASIDDRVKAIVLTGHGKKVFCAGQDLSQGFRLQGNGKNETERTHRDGGGRASLAIHRCSKPTIVAINGHAIGVGITMTLPGIMRITHRGAKIGFVFSQRGVVTEGCSSFFLPRLIGFSKTLKLLTMGATLTADNPTLTDLFAEVCEKQEEVLPRALQTAEYLVSNTSTVSTYMIREMLWRGPESAEEAHLLESRIMGHMRGSRDNDEAVDAFLHKRKAVFTGSVQKDSPPVHPWYTPINTKNGPVADPTTNGKPKL